MTLVDHRLKKVQGKKKRDAEAAEAKRKADLAVQSIESGPAAEAATLVEEARIEEALEEEESATVNLLSSKDEDVIF